MDRSSVPVPLLLVEDEPDLREALQEYLEACGFSVHAVATAQEALEDAQNTAPQVLLTDLTLPDRRGDAYLEDFHQLHPSCLLYIHSGDSTFHPTPQLEACGLTGDHVFAKPADLGEMVVRFHRDLAT